MSKIINIIKTLTDQIDKNGYEINGTKEISGITLPIIRIDEIDILDEENAVRSYYESININTQAVKSLEYNLYEYIYHGLKQSIEQLFYFNPSQDYTSRRFVFSTTDCISHLQILYRPHSLKLIAHLRSTDIKKLLPWDLLYLCKLLKRINNSCEFPHSEEKIIIVSVGSAHYYIDSKAMY